VATVVLKLFHIVQPDLAVFGRKDAQQCAVIDRMVRDLDVPVRLVFGETLREHDGLALSSRNSYLSADERQKAPVLHRALRAGEEALLHDVEDVGAVEKLMHRVIRETPGIDVDYLALVDPQTFERPADFRRDLLLVGAVRLGGTRLIDNIRVPGRAIPHTKI
jgi:pantoate--beta-alanine ligase